MAGHIRCNARCIAALVAIEIGILETSVIHCNARPFLTLQQNPVRALGNGGVAFQT